MAPTLYTKEHYHLPYAYTKQHWFLFIRIDLYLPQIVNRIT